MNFAALAKFVPVIDVVAALNGSRGSDEDFRGRFFVPGIQRAGGLSAALRLAANVRTLLPTPDEARETEGAALASALQPGAGRFLPFAQLPSALRQMRQSAPTRYQQVSQQIAAHLEGAAQTARSQGAPATAQSPNSAGARATGSETSCQNVAKAAAVG